MLLIVLVLGLGCRPGLGERGVVVEADGKEIVLQTSARTVREVLAEAGLTIDADDRVDPDLWVQIEDGMEIRILRVQEEIIVERETVPYRQQTIKSEALAAGEQKLLQAGSNGEVEVTYRVQFENGVEVARGILRSIVVQEPVHQITVVGVEGMTDSVEIPGTLAYLNSGNAWIMRVTSGGRHPVTTEGNLDGHVLALSPQGGHLLYTVPTDTVEYDGPFNDLYLLNVVLVDQEPQELPIGDVLWAGWSPDGRQVAYSTAVKSGSPGWKAHNDLWVVTLFDQEGRPVAPKPRRVLPPQDGGTYGWWGSRFAWSPDGHKIAYTRADQVGFVRMPSGAAFPLASFSPLNTHRDWVWVPTPSWSPDSEFVTCTIHGTEPGRPDEESQRFEVWALSLDQSVRARLTHPVGMWSTPRWSHSGQEGESLIAYAEADLPFSSHDSRYTLKVMDRDGSNKRALFPLDGQPGPAPPMDYVWSPDGDQLVLLYQGNLTMLDPVSGQISPLTADGQCTQLDWKR